jgi:hypothetical protein
MNFNNVQEEILAFCYEGPTELQTIVDIVQKFHASADSLEISIATSEILSNLMAAGLLVTLDKSISFTTSDIGAAMAEEYLAANEMFEYLKY